MRRYVVASIVVIVVLFIGFGIFHYGDVGVSAIKIEDLNNHYVLYEVDGARYDVPLGYHWWERLKRNEWPIPKKSYTARKEFSVSALLPDMQPYSQATKDMFENRRGKGNVIDIVVKSVSLKGNSINKMLDIHNDLGDFVKADENQQSIKGLVHYIDIGPKDRKKEDWCDVYVRVDENDKSNLFMRCDRKTERRVFPVCRVYDYGRSGDEPIFEYSFSRDHLSNSEAISDGVRELFSSFRR